MGTIVTIECDCGHTQDYPTAIPEAGSALHHHATVDTLLMLFDQHPCPHVPLARIRA